MKVQCGCRCRYRYSVGVRGGAVALTGIFNFNHISVMFHPLW